MPECKHHSICGLSSDPDPAYDGLCILHAKDHQKNKEAFDKALKDHCRERTNDYTLMFFPRGILFPDLTFSQKAIFAEATFADNAYFPQRFCQGADFSRATFRGEVSFEPATFAGFADFTKAVFTKTANFRNVTFRETATFFGATFSGTSIFIDTTFTGNAIFGGATFAERVLFARARFNDQAQFLETMFSHGADFAHTVFAGATVTFRYSGFHRRTLFSYRQERAGPNDQDEPKLVPVFSHLQDVDFRQVVIDPPDVVAFRGADLRRCRFLDTDLHKVQFTGVTWPEVGRLAWTFPGQAR